MQRLADILLRNGLDRPDVRPLHAYTIDDKELAALGRLLRLRIGTEEPLASTAQAFVLWAAEYLRTAHPGGYLTWDFVFAGLAQPRPDYAFVQRITEDGLRAWGRSLRRGQVGHREFLYSLLAEGGLPDIALAQAGTYRTARRTAPPRCEGRCLPRRPRRPLGHRPDPAPARSRRRNGPCGRCPPVLVARTQAAFEDFVRRWRNEHRLLLDAAATAADKDIRTAMEFRARRLAGEFLLGELARRGFTPAYGFPTDVVTFQNLRDRLPNADQPGKSFQRRGTASRPLDQAIREYAPGAEVVIDGLVHLSEGILPAWEAVADASGLED
ncbi:hypothetical protein [Gemmobacter denitrificans]|uniref:Uncharacterized protein n=1 Tax=Gemmobacter denitrificans TaxID=3123040 RepID=A0ABU8BYP8_9RHOB